MAQSKSAPPEARALIIPQDTDYCVYFWGKKRGERSHGCRKGASCRHWHDELHPTKWIAQQKRKREDMEQGEQLARPMLAFGPGFLKDRTTALRRWLQTNQVDSRRLRSTDVFEWPVGLDPPRYHVNLHLANVQMAGAESHMRLGLLNSIGAGHAEYNGVHLTCDNSRYIPREFFHGTSLAGALGVLRDGMLRPGKSWPRAVYAVSSREEIVANNLSQGYVIVFQVTGAISSSSTGKALKGVPCPGLVMPPNVCKRSAPEWRIHEDSITLLRIEAEFTQLQAIITAWWEQKAPHPAGPEEAVAPWPVEPGTAETPESLHLPLGPVVRGSAASSSSAPPPPPPPPPPAPKGTAP